MSSSLPGRAFLAEPRRKSRASAGGDGGQAGSRVEGRRQVALASMGLACQKAKTGDATRVEISAQRGTGSACKDHPLSD